MLIRLLQNFSSIELDMVAQPPDARIPRSWATAKGRKAMEKVWPKAHLTMYAHVRHWFILSSRFRLMLWGTGRSVGEDGRGKLCIIY
jgi:hypothetical protein